MNNMFDDPAIVHQLNQRLEELGFTMQEWFINTFHATDENHVYEVNNKYYDSYDYIYLINKNNRKDVFYLWIDVAWTEGMKEPVLFIQSMTGELVKREIESLEGDVEQFFDKKYLSSEETMQITNTLKAKYSIKPLPTYQKVIRKLVTSEQFEAIMQQQHFQH